MASIPAIKMQMETKHSNASGPSCGMKANAACCKNKDVKNCTAAEKAACAKAGKTCDHAKAEATETKETKSGLK